MIEIAQAIDASHRAGWSIGDAAFGGPTGLVWVVTGSNGENITRVEGATADDAWRNALGQARALGMLRPTSGRGL